MNTDHWHERRMVGFDLETTATEPEEARIVTAALALCGGGKATEANTWLADPGVPIPDEAAGIHGVTTERAQAEGAPAAMVVDEVVRGLQRLVNGGLPLVIFNARYDLTVLDREARRHGIEPLADRVRELYVVDPLVIDKWLDRYRKGSRKLDAICARYGARLDGAHDASADAVAAARTAWVLAAKGAVIRRARDEQEARERVALIREWERVRFDLPALHEAQRGWALDQAVGLAEYFREIGNPDADKVDTAWPFVPVAA